MARMPALRPWTAASVVKKTGSSRLKCGRCCYRLRMFSHLNNQCLFTSQSCFSLVSSSQSKRALQTVSWMKYKHTAVLLMRPNFALSYFRVSFKFISMINMPQTQATGHRSGAENISWRWTSEITYQLRPPFSQAAVSTSVIIVKALLRGAFKQILRERRRHKTWFKWH